MHQKLSWGLFLAGLFVFLGALGHEIGTHSTWSELVTPQTVGEILVQVGSVGVTVAGALGIVLKREDQ